MADAYILGPHRDTVNFSRATLMPFDMTLKQSYVNVSIHGLVRPENTADLDPALSNLLSNYLSGRETPIKAHPVPTPAMPAFLRDLLIHLPLISLNLPGSPDPDAQILQNVAIRQMRIDGTGPDSGILVSGSVVGDLVLPDGLDGLAKAIELKKLWPDVLVFDGSPNWTLDNKDFPPDPLPQGAFARLSPQDWSAVRTEVVEKEGHQVVQLEMKMSGAPMTVLPGRSDLFRSYMAKVLFGTGDGPHGQVRTGIWGFADVKAKLEPMPPLTLEDVFVQGEFLVSKSDVLGLRWLFS